MLRNNKANANVEVRQGVPKDSRESERCAGSVDVDEVVMHNRCFVEGACSTSNWNSLQWTWATQQERGNR